MNSLSTKVSACKLACVHLVILCLQSRRAPVSALLRIKKNVMDGIHDFGSGVHVAFDAGYLYTLVLLMPSQKTNEELQFTECGLPKLEMYVKIDGAPTKSKVV